MEPGALSEKEVELQTGVHFEDSLIHSFSGLKNNSCIGYAYLLK